MTRGARLQAHLISVFPRIVNQASGSQGSFVMLECLFELTAEIAGYGAVVFEADLSANDNCS